MYAIRVNENIKVNQVSSRTQYVRSDSNLVGFFIGDIVMKRVIETDCQWCNKKFTHRKDHPNKYCSRQCAGLSRRHQIKCKYCGEGVKKSRNIFCSIKCMNLYKTAKTVKTILCDECGILFSKHQCHLTRNNFCSVKCRKIGMQMPIGSTHIIYNNGYKRKWIKISQPNIWQLNAIFVWTNHFGKIPHKMLIHHKDENTLNDIPTNLELMNRKLHSSYHRRKCLIRSFGMGSPRNRNILLG